MKLFKKKSCCGEYKAEGMKVSENKGIDARIKVLGSGCAKCNSLEQNVKEALLLLGMSEDIEHVTDFAEISRYGVMSTPALVIDGKVVSFGKVLDQQQIIDILKKGAF